MSTATPNTPEPCDCSKHCIHRLKAREQEAWDFAFRHYDDPLARKIYFFLAKRGLPFDDATIDDIRQQTWITATRRIDDFIPQFNPANNGCGFGAWLNAIAFNHVRNLGRKLADDVSFDDYDEPGDGVPSLDHFEYTNGLSEGSADEVIDFQEALSEAEAILSQLSPRDREIFIRRHAYGETPRALAREYKLPPKTISQILTRAKRSINGNK
jgi:RNA polymerase sigma factor (sigma-70 family)